MRVVYGKVTNKMKEIMIKLRGQGLSYKKIGEILGVSQNTVQYHLDPIQRRKSHERAIRNAKPRNRNKYMKEYFIRKYKTDIKFREAIRKSSREYKRRKSLEKSNGKNNNLHKD